jgi:zinc protease
LREGAQRRIQQQTYPLMVNHSRYADREPIGTEEVLKNFNRETIYSFYKDWYRPDLQAIIVVGDVDVKDVVKQIEKLFSDLKNPEPAKPRPVYTIALTGKNQFLAVTDKEAQGTLMQVMIKYPHKKLESHLDYLDYIKRNLFNQVLALRFRAISQKNTNNYLGANAGLTSLAGNVDAFNASLSVRSGELEKGFAAFWSEIAKIKAQGFTETEITMAKSQYLNSIQASLAERDKKQSAQYANEYLRLFLKGEASPGIAKEAALTEAYLPTISVGHLNQMAKQYIGDINRDVIIIAPETAELNLPTAEEINTWFTKYENGTTTTNNVEEQRMASKLAKMPIIATPPVKGKITSTTEINALNVTELKLSNGVRVILKPTSFKNNEIIFNAYSPGGTSLYPDVDFQSATNAASLIAAGGIGDFDADMLRQKLSGKSASVGPYISERGEGISGYSDTKELETALQLTYLYFTSPRKDTAVFNSIVSRGKAAFENAVRRPEKVFADTLSAILSNNNIRRKPAGLAELEQLNLDKSFEIYKDRFSDASDFTFVIVGNFDLAKIKPLLAQYLGALPSTGRKETAKDLHIQIPAGVIKKTVYSGSENKATVQLVLSGDYLYSEANKDKLEAIKYILGLRMLDRLREQEGGVYSPSVSLTSSRTPRSRYAFFIGFGCSPANVEKLVAAAWEEIAKLKANGPSAEDVAKFKAEQKVGIKNALETNRFWLSYLSNQYQEQYDLKEILNFDTVLDGLSTENLKEAINIYLNDKNYIQAVLMPEK